MNLQTLIDCLTLDSKIHICINDISGILTQPNLKIRTEYTIHSKPFCLWAKSTNLSNRRCHGCKHFTIRKAVMRKTPFVGRCIFGVTEVVYPVEIDGDVMAIIYVGNLTDDIEELKAVIERRSQIFKLPRENIHMYLQSFCLTSNFEPYLKMAEFIRDMILSLYDKYGVAVKRPNHWIVDALKSYAETYYNTEMSLTQLSKLYYFNENYIGRLFKKQTGKTFSEYLNNIRLRKAFELLKIKEQDKSKNMSILKIAALSGFNNVTYFNRVFKRSTGITPSEYRNNTL